jgi:uncharacterized protein
VGVIMEINLDKIKLLCQKNENINMKFRSFLKGYANPGEIDFIVHNLFKEISIKIDCTQCANCCKTIGPILCENDIDNLSKLLNLNNDEFINTYLKRDDEGDLVLNNIPCLFLKENKCSVYSKRPEDCRSYPHLQKDEFISRLYAVITNCSVCPIVFNVYEKLKEIVWGKTKKHY